MEPFASSFSYNSSKLNGEKHSGRGRGREEYWGTDPKQRKRGQRGVTGKNGDMRDPPGHSPGIIGKAKNGPTCGNTANAELCECV